MRLSRYRATLAIVVMIAAIGCSPATAVKKKRQAERVNPDVLTEAEAQRAVEIASADSRVREYFETDQPVFVAQVELLRLKEAETDRFALVSHYRYEGDLTIQSTVDLSREVVSEVEAIPHLPTPLAPEELARARELALANEELRGVLEDRFTDYTSRRQGFEIEALVLRTASKEDPIFGHRVVSLLFKTPRGYLAGVETVVDLTTGELTIERKEMPR